MKFYIPLTKLDNCSSKTKERISVSYSALDAYCIFRSHTKSTMNRSTSATSHDNSIKNWNLQKYAAQIWKISYISVIINKTKQKGVLFVKKLSPEVYCMLPSSNSFDIPSQKTLHQASSYLFQRRQWNLFYIIVKSYQVNISCQIYINISTNKQSSKCCKFTEASIK